MIYAYDKGILLPISSIYDTLMMLAQVAAAKDMYEKAAQEMKDFKKEFGDFYSSRPSDMEWYSKEYGKILNLINSYYQQGINPLRSAEARGEINRAINNFDYAQYAARKKSAVVYDEYMKNKAALEKAGLYDPMFELYMMNKEGVSLDDPVFSRQSPAPYFNEMALTNDIFSGMKPEYIRTDKQGIDWKGVTPERRKLALAAQLDTVLNTPSGQYMYEQARQQLGPNASEKDVKNALMDRIIYATGKFDYEDEDFNRMKIGMEQQKLGLEYQKIRQQQANADRSFMLELAKAGISVDPKTGKFVSVGAGDSYIQPVDLRQEDKNANSRADALSNWQSVFIEAIKNDQKHIDLYNKEKNASDLGYKTIENSPMYVGTPGGGGSYIRTTKQQPYIKNKNSEEKLAQLKNNADIAQRNINFFESILKKGPEALIEQKYLDEYGYPTEKYTKLMTRTYLNKNRMAGMSEEEKKLTVHGLFNSLYSAGNLAQGDFSDWRTKQFGGDKLEKLPGTKDEKLLSTKTGKYKYAPVYENNAFGIKASKQENDFNTWLQNNKRAWVWDPNQLQDYFMPSKSGEKYSTFGTILISREDIEDFAKQYGYNVDDFIKKLKFNAHIYKNDIGNAVTAQYYEIPVFDELANNGGFNYYRINENVTKNDFGTKLSSEDRTNAQLHSVMNR